MKEKMYSRESNSMLHDHIIDGFETTHQGLRQLKEDKLITTEEYTNLLEQNIKRLVNRIHEFRIKEGMLQAARRVACIYFACFFAWAQINGNDLEMRRTSRTRTSRNVRSRTGRRRMEEDIGGSF